MRWGNYLRVRGEYCEEKHMRLDHSELPPRARRIPPMVRNDRGKNGTTSACAENTIAPTLTRASCRNYLRVRGEYFTMNRMSRI